MSSDEFSIIHRYFSHLGYRPDRDHSAIKLGVGDDCALLEVPAGEWLAMSVDSLVAGVHFPADARPFDIAQRALAVNLSDLAGMGAKPLCFTLALTLPEAEDSWLQGFSRGLSAAAQRAGIPLVGGNIAHGPLNITIQVQGTVPAGGGLRRRGAEFGDLVFVTGTLGDARGALDVLQRSVPEGDAAQYLLGRYFAPQARLAVGRELLGVASAAIDISDGLLADLGHILESAEGLAAEIHLPRLPLSRELLACVARDTACRYALNGGDDYELCFTARDYQREVVLSLGRELGVPISEIGRIVPGSGIVCRGADGGIVDVDKAGYRHFE